MAGEFQITYERQDDEMIAIIDYYCYQNLKVPVKSRVLRYENCYIF